MIGKSTASTIIYETCSILWKQLAPIYLQKPNLENWLEIEKGFSEKWNFPHCLGAIDGKHIAIQAPNKSGSEFFNYKKFFSIVLLGACDANYNFTLVDIGAHGSLSDGAVFKDAEFGQAITNNKLHIPNNTILPGGNVRVNYVFVADEAFPLQRHIMRPFPGSGLNEKQRIFNYRLSRARRTIEHAFGILASRWRIFHHNIIADVTTIQYIVGATVCLHNFLIQNNSSSNLHIYCPDINSVNDYEIDSSKLLPLGRTGSNNPATIVKTLRNTFAEYFISEHGELPHQYAYVNRGSF